MTEQDFERQLNEVVTNIHGTVEHLEARVQEAIALITLYEDAILQNDAENLANLRDQIERKRGESNDKILSHVRPIMDLGKLFSS